MTITNSPNAILNWQTFSIGTQNSVRFEQQNAASQVLNRVVGNDPSSILGSLSSNGGVWLVNPHGVLFGPNARIDVGGLVASTLGISNDDFLTGRFKFEGTNPLGGQVLNQGEINTTFGGHVWLMGDSVRNEGLIQSPGGNIVLAAGKSIELVDSGMPNVTVRVTAPENEALNLGSLLASASGSIDLHGGIVNQQGIVRADSVGTDAAGRVVIKAQGDVRVSGKVSATSAEGKGGQIHLLGKNVGLVEQATLDASGAADGGEILVGGDHLGSNHKVPNAHASFVGEGTTLKANATVSGDGGRIIVWGNDATRVYGSIEAKGAAAEGKGGFVETSGGYLDARPRRVDVSSESGQGGTWLLDPNNITIADNDGDVNVTMGPNFTSTNDDSIVSTSTLNSALDTGGTVQVITGIGDTSSQRGNITVADSISKTTATAASLVLQAHGDITVNSGVRIESTTGPMAVTFVADSDGDNAGGIMLHGSTTAATRTTISTNGGNIFMSGAGLGAAPSVPEGTGIVINGGILEAGTGNINLTGVGTGVGQGIFITGPIINGVSGSVRSKLTARDIDIQGKGISSSGVAIGLTDITATGSLTIGGDLDSSPTNFGVTIFDSSALSAASISVTSNDSVWITNLSGDVGPQLPSILTSSGSITVAAPLIQVTGGSTLDAGGRINITSTGTTTLNGAQLHSSTGGDAITISAARVGNTGSVVSAPEGRWLIYLGTGQMSSFASDLGGLDYKFVQFNAPYATDPARSGVGQNGVLLSDPLNVQVKVNATRPYDGTVRAIFDDYLSHDAPAGFNVETIVSDGDATVEGAFQNKNVGIDKPISFSGEKFLVSTSSDTPVFGSTLSYVGDITPRIISTSGVTAANKIYDATRTAMLAGSLSGGIAGDDVILNGVTGLFDTKNVGTGKTVSISGGSLEGGDKDNYSLIGTGTTTADITARQITAAGLTAADKVYDGTRNATISGGSLSQAIAGDDLTLNGATGLFDTRNVGTDKLVTISGGTFAGADKDNYSLIGTGTTTADITARQITAAGLTAADKVYDGTRNASISGGSLSQAIAGDDLTLNGATGLFDTKNVGTDKLVTISGGTFAGADKDNYDLLGTGTTTADITAKPITIGIAGSAAKEYDATTTASLNANQFVLNDVIPNDAISVAGPEQGSYDSPNVGTEKPVTATGAFQISGADAPNYSIGAINLTNATSNTVSTIANGNVGTITHATLVYNADPAVRELGLPVAGLTGNVTGFKGADNVTTATSGTLGWQAIVPVESLPGSYAVEGTGLSAGNYVFTQAPGNATALVLMPINTANAPQQQAVESSTSAIVSALRSVVLATSPRGSGGGVFDNSSPAVNRYFGPINIASMSQEELTQWLEARKNFKRKLFADGIYKLEIDPSLADVQPCPSVADAASGLCRITTAQLDEIHASKAQAVPASKSVRARTASLPQIERKIAVLFGINDYDDKTIPRLENAVPDVDAVSKVLAEKLGYEVKVVRNPNKAEIIRTLNELSIEINASDSVVVYYAGHGYSLEKNGAGYWLPSDAPVNDPSRWISNSDIAKLLAGIRSKQMALISDSCYSGAFARDGMASVGRDVTAEDVLTKRSVVVLSSGGDEPVADEGKDGHSIFAWNLMKTVGSVENWRPGSTIFNEVQLGVKKEFPQTPKYGSVTSAGHQAGGDYLFELR
jgi:filamentous hemagglutinin family protein